VTGWGIERIQHFDPGDLVKDGFVHFGFHDRNGRQFAIAHTRHFLGQVGDADRLDWTVARAPVFPDVPNITADLEFPMFIDNLADGSLLVSNFECARLYRIDVERMRADLLVDGHVLGMADMGNGVVDAAGSVWVNEVTGCRVWRFDATGRVIGILGTGQPGFQPDSADFDEVRFNWIYDIRRGPDDAIYVLDSRNFALRVIDIPARRVVTIAGTGSPGYTGDGGDARQATFGSDPTARFDGPISLSLDELGNAYIGDRHNHVVRILERATRTIATIAGNPAVDRERANDPAERDPGRLNLPQISSMDYHGGRLFVPTDLAEGHGDLIVLRRSYSDTAPSRDVPRRQAGSRGRPDDQPGPEPAAASLAGGGGPARHHPMSSPFEPAALADALIDAEPGAAARRNEIRIVRAPGRVNLIGEHTDYNEGFVLPAAIDLEIRIAYLPAPDRRVELTRLDTGDRDGFDLDTPRARNGSWLDYVAGTAWALTEAGLPLTGLRGVVASSLPTSAGLSSSAAIELASAWAMLGDLAETVDRFELARRCQRAENAYVGVNSGLMDQFAESCGVAGAALFLDCRSSEWRPVPLPPDLDLVVLHTGSRRSLSRSEYNVRRSQCEAAVSALSRLDPSVRSLRDVTPGALAAAAARLEPVEFRRARHIVSENERVGATVAALEAGDLGAVGELFAASHASLRDDFEVSSPELDAMVEIAVAVPGVAAARMTGAGFGGCTVNLVRPDAVGALTATVREAYPTRTGLTPMILPVRVAPGAGRIVWQRLI